MGIRIENEKLIVEIAEAGQYDGSRFDWTGFIRQVTLKQGSHTFCAYESLIPGKGTGGVGLCNEFGINAPIGYQETAVGDRFHKIGVGLLTREDSGDYNFFNRYLVQPFPVQTFVEPDHVRFISEAVQCNGYAFRLEKTILVGDASLTISYNLHNTGSKTITTNEYVHNFLAIDGLAIGPEYVLRLPVSVAPQWHFSDSPEETPMYKNREIRWTRLVDKVFYGRFTGFDDQDVPFYWELIHSKAGAGVREKGSARGAALALWGEQHVVSPEVFVNICVKPGDAQTWTRTYDFFETV